MKTKDVVENWNACAEQEFIVPWSNRTKQNGAMQLARLFLH